MEKLKERVFGLIVILALGIIFIPMFFTKKISKNSLDTEEDQIPQILTELDQEASFGGWDVQVGAFAVPEHAATLVKKLKKQGFPAYSHHTVIEGRTLTIVYLGPIVRKEDATKLMATLASKFELQGSIVYHSVRN